MNVFVAIVLSLTSLVAGAFFAWLFTFRRASKNASILQKQINDLAQERGQLIERSSRVSDLSREVDELEKLRTRDAEEIISLREQMGSTKSELNSERGLVSELRAKLHRLELERHEVDASLAAANVEKATLSSKLSAEMQQSSEKIKLMQDAREQLTTSFESLANRILEEKSKKFTDQNSENLGAMLNPLREKIKEFQEKVESVYDLETRDRTALGEQVRQLMQLNNSLSQDAKNLTSALKGSSKTQGSWGELVLERILEASGLRKGEEYVVQSSYTNEDASRSQPDITVNLPEQRHLVIDSKVSLVAYDTYVNSDEEDPARLRALKQHMDSVRSHVKSLSTKGYQDIYQLHTLDFVLLFVPIESAFMLAVTNDRDLFMDGWNKNVLLVSPSTLLFVLRTVAHLWRQEAQTKNAQQIAKRGSELYDRLCGFVADLEQVGSRLKQAQDSYDNAKNKLSQNKGNVIRQAEMLKNLGVKPNKSLPASFASNDDDGDENGNQEMDGIQE